MKTQLEQDQANGYADIGDQAITISPEAAAVRPLLPTLEDEADDERRDKARRDLAAAGPELLQALEAAVKYLDDNRPKGKIKDIFHQLNQHENGVLKPARAAIDKAKGQS